MGGSLSEEVLSEAKTEANKVKYMETKVLVIGSTGAGKSSLINLIYIMSQGIKKDQLSTLKKVLIKTKYHEGDDSTEFDPKQGGASQTQHSKDYNIKLPFENKSIQIFALDTPGLGDTRGIEFDEKNVENIVDAVKKTEDLNAILLVLNGTDQRVYSRIMYVVNKLKCLIPDVMKDNLFTLLTSVNCTPNLNIEDLEIKIPKNHQYFYDNAIFSVDPKDLLNNKKLRTKVEESYADCSDVIAKVIIETSKCCAVPTTAFKEIKESRDKMKKGICTCLEQENLLHIQQTKIEEEIKKIESAKVDFKSVFQELLKEIPQKHWIDIPAPSHNTNCLSCHKTCHEHCYLDKIEEKGSALFKNCSAFNGHEMCRECGHNYSSHLHEKCKHKEEIIYVKLHDPKIIEEMKKLEDGNKIQGAIIKQLLDDREKLADQVDGYRTQVVCYTQDLKKICSQFDYIREIDSSIKVTEERINMVHKKFDNINLVTDEKHQKEKAEYNEAINSLDVAKKYMEKIRTSLIESGIGMLASHA